MLATRVEVWRLLDLSGMTNSVRESRNFTKSGFVYVNGNSIRTLGATVEMGSINTIELRFTNGKVKSKLIMPIPRPLQRKPRQTGPRQLNYRG